MGSLDGKFSDQNPFVLSAQLITAKTNVKTDLNAILVENDQIRATNTFLITQNVGNSNAAGGIGSAVAQTAIGTVGAAQTAGEIGSGGLPCFIATTRIELPDNNWRFIADMRIGDSVMSFDPVSGMIDTGMVVAVMKHLVPNYQIVEFENGHTTGVDADGGHRYWIGKGEYQPIRELEQVFRWDDMWEPEQIVSRRIVGQETVLYNLTVANNHNYIANHHAVSNSKIQPELENPEVV